MYFFNPLFNLLDKHVAPCQTVLQYDSSIIPAWKCPLGYTKQSDADILPLEEEEEECNPVKYFHSGSVVSDKHTLGTFFSPGFVNKCAGILECFCLGGWQVLEDQLLSIFQSYDFELDALQPYLTTRINALALCTSTVLMTLDVQDSVERRRNLELLEAPGRMFSTARM